MTGDWGGRVRKESALVERLYLVRPIPVTTVTGWMSYGANVDNYRFRVTARCQFLAS